MTTKDPLFPAGANLPPIPAITVEDARKTTIAAIQADPQYPYALAHVLEAVQSTARAGKWHVILGMYPDVLPLVMEELKSRGFEVREMRDSNKGNLGVGWSRPVPESKVPLH